MSSPSTVGRFSRYSVPVAVFLIVLVAVLVVPPLAMSGVTARTYAIAGAVVILAVRAAFVYAVLVAVGTLPFLATDVGSFAAPEIGAGGAHSLSGGTAVRHVAAGVSYALGAAVVGAVGMGAQIAVGEGSTAIPEPLRPVFLFLGGVIVAVAFVGLQLWQYHRFRTELNWPIVLGTVTLGVLLALSPLVALWVFSNPI